MNLDEQFVTIEILEKATGDLKFTQEVPRALIGRFLISFDFVYNRDTAYEFKILSNNRLVDKF